MCQKRETSCENFVEAVAEKGRDKNLTTPRSEDSATERVRNCLTVPKGRVLKVGGVGGEGHI